jgi:excisionase family DNA binding protein
VVSPYRHEPSADDQDDLLPTRESTRLLGISDKTLSRYVDAGLIRPVWLPGRQRRFRRGDLLALLTEHPEAS